MGQLVAIHTGMIEKGDPTQLEFAELNATSGVVQAETAGGVVNVVENEVYLECQERNYAFAAGDFGEHLTVEWVALDTLQPGDVLFVEDEVQLEVVGPYHIPDWIPDLQEVLSFVSEPIGIQGKVLSGGTIAPEMMVHVELRDTESEY